MSEVESQSGRNSPFPEGTNRRGSLLEPLPAYKQVQLEFIQVSAYVQDLMKQIEGPKEAKKQVKIF